MSAVDDFWLYDAPINPINVPSFLVFDKPDVPPETFVNRMNERLGREHRCAVKLVKFWGKYFFKKLDDNEWANYKKTKLGVIDHVKTEKEAIELILKLKSLEGKNDVESTVWGYYFPSLNNDKEAAIMAMGHHSHQDGISQFQSFYMLSDDPGKSYPFYERPSISLYQKMIIYCSFLIS